MRRAVSHRTVLFAAARGDGSLPPLLAELPPREWDPLVTRAAALGMAGHLHTAIARDRATTNATESSRSALEQHYYACAARNAALHAVLRQVLEALAANEIPVVVLKGAALAGPVYGDLGVRPMYDLDLLVPEGDLTRAADTLFGLGFAANEWFRDVDWYRANMHHLAPFHRDGITVELHHRLTAPTLPRSRNASELWLHAHEADVAGVRTQLLSPTDLLLHLLEHLVGAHHLLGGLSRIRDIVEVSRVHRDGIDWERFVRACDGRERVIAAGLLASVAIGAASIPSEVVAAVVRSGGLRRLETRALTRLARRHALIALDDAAVPVWFSVIWLEGLLERRSWIARTVALLRGTREQLTEAGRREGYRALALPYGVFVHPWNRVRRLLRGAAPTQK